MMKHQISIIIPTLNEADNIKKLLLHLLKNAFAKNISEIIIVDGGSTDGSQNIIKNYLSDRAQSKPNNNLSTALKETIITCLHSEKGRAKQMNLGAKYATGNIFYFLHADSFPPKHFDEHIINQVEKGNNAGCFKMKFNSNHWWLLLAGQLTRLSWKSCRGGDQSLFITKPLFNTIEGFNENFKIYEDNELISKLYACNEFVIIPKWITTSARRYNTNGIWKLQFHFWTIHLKKWMGASPQTLNKYYLKHVSVKK